MDQKTKIKANFGITIETIDLVSYNSYPTEESVEPKKVNFSVKYNINGNVSEGKVVVDCIFDIHKDKTQELLLGSIASKGVFNVQTANATGDFNEYPLEVFATTLSTLMATMRGMLVILSKGTPFEKGFFPIINTLHMMQEAAKTEAQKRDKHPDAKNK